MQAAIFLAAHALVAVLLSINADDAEPKRPSQYFSVFRQTSSAIVQVWIVPNQANIDVQSVADKHLPCSYTAEMGLFIKPPRTYNFQKFSIEELPKQLALETIDFSGTTIEDEDLNWLSKCKSLRILVLDRTKISDRGLKILQECKSIERLGVFETNVTNEGLSEFKGANTVTTVSVATESKIEAMIPK